MDTKSEKSQLVACKVKRLQPPKSSTPLNCEFHGMKLMTTSSSPNKMTILGQMGELGKVSHEEHQKVIDQLQAAQLENVWLVGDEFADIDCPYRKFHDVEEVKDTIRQSQPHDHYILIKGSNSVKLFQLTELL